MRIVTGGLRPTPTKKMQITASIKPAELRRKRSTLSLAYRSLMNPIHLLHQLMVGPIPAL